MSNVKTKKLPIQKNGQDVSIKIKTSEENPEPIELIAKSIVEISEAFAKLNRGLSKQYLAVVLIHDITGLAKRDIKKVLDAVEVLKSTYLHK